MHNAFIKRFNRRLGRELDNQETPTSRADARLELSPWHCDQSNVPPH